MAKVLVGSGIVGQEAAWNLVDRPVDPVQVVEVLHALFSFDNVSSSGQELACIGY